MTDALARLQHEVASCRKCPRLVAWREEVARTKVARFADEEYWGQARNSGIPSSGGMVYWDTGMGPQLVPDQPGGSWP